MDEVQQLLDVMDDSEELALSSKQVESALGHLDAWTLIHDEVDGYKLEREFELPTAREAIEFVNRLNEGAHQFPDLHILSTMVLVTCYTEDVVGLTHGDFQLAAHADDLHARWDIITGKRDAVTEASDESFPASDPPAY